MKIDFKNINSFKITFKSNRHAGSKTTTKNFEGDFLNILSENNKFFVHKAKTPKPVKSDELDKKLEEISKNPNYQNSPIGKIGLDLILRNIKSENELRLLLRALNDDKFKNNDGFINHLWITFNLIHNAFVLEDKELKRIFSVMDTVSEDEKLYKNDTLMTNLPVIILSVSKEEDFSVLKRILAEERFYNNERFLYDFRKQLSDKGNKVNSKNILKLMDREDILPQQYSLLYDSVKNTEKIAEFNKAIGFDTAQQILPKDIKILLDFIPYVNLTSADNFTNEEKTELLNKIIKSNTDLFLLSDNTRKHFPILPKNQSEYCALVSGLASSIKSYKPFNSNTTDRIYNSLFSILDKTSSLDKKENLEEDIDFLSENFPVLKDKKEADNFIKSVHAITKSPLFKDLNKEDKKILLLTSMFYNSSTSPSDAYYNLKATGLEDSELNKIFILLKNKNWTDNLFSNLTDETIKIISYNFRFDNVFDLACILSYDKFKLLNSKGKLINMFIKRIKDNIVKLNETQPLLPVTKFPSADRINEVITKVNEDGSTNIKGIYKDKDGLIIINYNEVENKTWEKIGFKRGTISRGIKTKDWLGNNINTGNIKFFVHGLDENEQLANFEAFNLPSSDALLSVSYAERPESKYTFYRPQGIILDVENENIHTGLDTDMHTGFKKTLEERIYSVLSYRTYTPFMLQEDSQLSKKEYSNLVQKYQNKQFSDIYPVKLRNELIKLFASHHPFIPMPSQIEHNEFLITNPKPPMAVFACTLEKNEKIDNPVDFLNKDKKEFDFSFDYVSKRTDFLRKYALSHNIPFVIFGE